MKLTRAHRLHRLFVSRESGTEMHLFDDLAVMLEYVYSICSPDEFIECEHQGPRPVAEILNN